MALGPLKVTPPDLLPDLLLSHSCPSPPALPVFLFSVVSSVPLPHSKRCIPSDHDCYHGNCSNKNKYPSADFDLSEIHKFVNKRPDKG